MPVQPNSKRRPIVYASRTLNEHEKRHAQIDKVLAIMFGWPETILFVPVRPSLKFTIQTDHKPLELILNQKLAFPSLAAMRFQR